MDVELQNARIMAFPIIPPRLFQLKSISSKLNAMIFLLLNTY